MNIEKLFDLSDRTVLLTGAAGLLGRQYAEGLSQAGANVILSDVNYSECKKIENELHKKYKCSSLSVKVDISSEKSVKNMVKVASKRFSSIDVLINNAVFPETRKERSIPFEKFPLPIWNQIISVNLNGMFLCSREVGKIMKKQKNGSIINISSIYGMVAADQRIYKQSGLNSTAAYAVTKSAVLNFTRYLASYWNGCGIRVNSLTLGGVENNQDSEFVKNYSNKTMIGRMARKDEYVGAMLFLASDASSYMTGANLVIDGGWTSW